MNRTLVFFLLALEAVFPTVGRAQGAKHENVAVERPTSQQIPTFVDSISTKPIEQVSSASFAVDREGNRETIAPVLVLEQAQTVSVEHEQTDGDQVWTALVRSDGQEHRFLSPGNYPVESGTYRHHANGTIYGSGKLESRVTYYRLVPDCSKLTQLPLLGWGSGNKHRFCVAKGYTSVTNTSTGGNDYRKNAGGWCYVGKADACQAILDGLSPSSLSPVDRRDGYPPRPSERERMGGEGADR